MKEKFEEFTASNPISGTAAIKDGKLVLNAVGKAAHGQEPRNGVNAATYLAVFLNQFDFERELQITWPLSPSTCMKIHG